MVRELVGQALAWLLMTRQGEKRKHGLNEAEGEWKDAKDCRLPQC